MSKKSELRDLMEQHMTDLETLKAQRDALLYSLERLLAVLPKPGDRAYLNHYARIEADEARSVVADVRNTEGQRP